MQIIWVGSPYLGYPQGVRGGNVPRAIVLHIAQGNMAAVDAWFNSPENMVQNGGSSAHYCVGRDGVIHSYVKEEDAAWANGVVNKPTIPIEGNPNNWTLSIEHEGISGEPWTDEMYAADVFLLRGISERWGIPIDATHVFGHNRIDSVNRKNCPGSGLDWQRLWREVKGGDMIQTKIVNPFPRGLILHLSPNGYYPLGRPEHWDKWIAEIKAMGFDGVKVIVFDDANAPDKQQILAIKKLLDAGLQVVVRLFRATPNSGILTNRHIEVVKLLVSMGVVFFETNNEPNLRVEWQGNDFGDMAREVVGENWVVDAKRIVECGGYPAIPAMSPGGDLDDQWFLEGVLQEIAARASTAILEKTWLAVHNYSLNHPLAYPDEPINRTGQQLTPAEYDVQGPFTKSLVEVNKARVAGRHVTGSIMDAGESNGFRKGEMVHALALSILKADLPVISTEGGAVMDVGFSGDPRYPLVMDEGKHAAINVDRAQYMMKGKGPSYFWADCMWVMANRLMENPVSAGFEGHSWYPYWKESGLAVVQAFKDMPKQNRPTIPVKPGTIEDAAVRAREWCWNARFKEAGGFNPIASFQKPERIDLGVPVTSERYEGGFVWQGFALGIRLCKEGDWNNIFWMTWTGDLTLWKDIV